jgi:hypothetical protein
VAIDAKTPLPTPDGWTAASDIRPGDLVFCSDGGTQRVLSVQSHIPSACYRVELSGGLSIVGDHNMTFSLQCRKWRNRLQMWIRNQSSKFAKKRFRRPLAVRSVAQMLDEGLDDNRNRKKWALTNIEPLRYPHVDLPVPPYVLGLWLGSMTKSGRHWVRGKDMERISKKCRRHGFFITQNRGEFFFRPSVRESFTFAGAPIPDKIPSSYLESDVESRQMLLEGLIDSEDAKKQAHGEECYTIQDSWLSAKRKQQLLESLGHTTSLTKRDDRARFALNFCKILTPAPKNRRQIVKIDKIRPRQCVHIVTEHDFVAAEGFLSVKM